MINLAQYPSNWDEMKEGEEIRKCLIDPEAEDEEYHRISDQFHLTLPNSAVIKIYRIQNKALWTTYRTCSEDMMVNNDGILNEQLLFHGTSSTDPKDIYEGSTGFDIRFARIGMWGTGNYFAQNASYSTSFVHCSGATKEMFAASVLTGIPFSSQPNSTLKMPPERVDHTDGEVKRRYDSVTGHTRGTRVYITYDEKHSYPSYLIVYQ